MAGSLARGPGMLRAYCRALTVCPSIMERCSSLRDRLAGCRVSPRSYPSWCDNAASSDAIGCGGGLRGFDQARSKGRVCIGGLSQVRWIARYLDRARSGR